MRPFLSSEFTLVIHRTNFVNHIYLVTLPSLIKYFTLLLVYYCLFIGVSVNYTVCPILIYVFVFIIIRVMYLQVILLKTTH